jgi:hypothetical protein
VSTKTKKEKLVAEPVAYSLSLHEICELIAKHFSLTEGKYELTVEFKIGMGAVGSTPEDRVPGAMIGVNKIGLLQIESEGPLTINISGTKQKD